MDFDTGAAPVKLGAVGYLNARPLVHGLERRPDLFDLRFDAPSRCAVLLHENAIDVGMIPSIEYCRGPEYRIVPGLGIISNGRVASVALFTSKPLADVRSVAADTSSRTSNALLLILCRERFKIDPLLRAMDPDPARMLGECDAALIIGDPALNLDHVAAGVEKIDLGEAWTSMTHLPFVWAFWAGRPPVLSPRALRALTDARNAGVAAADEIAAAYCSPGEADRGRAYLRENIQYTLGPREEAGLRTYYKLAERHALIERARPLRYYAHS